MRQAPIHGRITVGSLVLALGRTAVAGQEIAVVALLAGVGGPIAAGGRTAEQRVAVGAVRRRRRITGLARIDGAVATGAAASEPDMCGQRILDIGTARKVTGQTGLHIQIAAASQPIDGLSSRRVPNEVVDPFPEISTHVLDSVRP